MSARVMVELRDEEPIAIKRAAGAQGTAALNAEAERLRRAAHPGVVSLLELRSSSDGAELCTGFAGEPIARWHGDLTLAAGLCAAIAATLADLHQIGVVHGHVDGTHVLVGGDGRPRLCGFSDPGGATPPDDVAAVGRLLDELIAASAHAEGRRTAPWRRGMSRERRALARVVARAIDPVPTRRPSAQGLASSILAAVPDADLPAVDPELPAGAGPPPWPIGCEGDVAPDYDDYDDYDDFWDAPAARYEGSVDDWLADPDPTDEIDVRHDATDDLTRPRATTDEGPDEDLRGCAAGAAEPFPTCDEPESTVPEWQQARQAASELHRPADRAVQRARGSRRGPVVAGAASVLCLGLMAVGGLTVLRPASAARETGSGAGGAQRTAGIACRGVTASAADLDGDGCPDAIHIDGAVIEAAGARWAVGQPGDQIAVGDWDCDGVASPAVLRPTTGDVFAFSGWAVPGEPQTVEPIATIDDGRALEAEELDGSCRALIVRRADGTTVTVAGAG